MTSLIKLFNRGKPDLPKKLKLITMTKKNNNKHNTEKPKKKSSLIDKLFDGTLMKEDSLKIQKLYTEKPIILKDYEELSYKN